MKKLLIGISAIVIASSAHADIAFNSFGTGDSYNTGNPSYIIGTDGGTNNWSQAFKFQSSATGVVDTIRFVADHSVGTDAGFHMALHSDSVGTPGAFLLGVSFASPVGGGIYTYSNPFPSQPVLSAGQDYWLRFYSDDPSNGWNLRANDQGMTTDRARDIAGGTNWTYDTNGTPAMEITVDAVPEPMTMIGLAGLALVAARKRRVR